MAKRKKTKSTRPEKALPQPYEGESEMLFHPRDAIGLCVTIGSICTEWSLLEMTLSFHYALLVFGARENKDQAELTVIEAFESLPTWQTKCNLLRAAAEPRLGKDTAKKLGTLLSSFEYIQKRRNNVVHGRWQTTDKSPKEYVRSRGILGPKETWTPECFTQLRNDIREAMQKLETFFGSVRERLKHGAYWTALNEMLKTLPAPEQSDDTP